MKTSESTAAITTALIAARARIPTIPRAGQGQVGTRTYNYALLDDILSVVIPALAAEGVLLMQPMGNEGLVTRFTHGKTGEYFESDPLLLSPDRPGLQGMGAVVTYTKRYELQSMFGLATGEDTDGVSTHEPAEALVVDPAPKPWTPNASKAHAKRMRATLEKCENLEDLEGWKRDTADDRKLLGPPDKQELVMRATTIHGALKKKAESAAT